MGKGELEQAPAAHTQPAFVLVVEDDAVTRAILLRSLATVGGLSVIAAASVDEARSVLATITPRLLVLDLELPDGHGLDLLAEFPADGLPHVVVHSAHLDRLGPFVDEDAHLTQLPKPLDVDALRAVAKRLVDDNAEVGLFSLAEYLQLACLGGHSVVIECQGDGLRGHVVVREGKLWDATAGDDVGTSAFARLVALRASRVVPLDVARAGERRIQQPWEGVLLDGLRAYDEANGIVCDDDFDDVAIEFDLAPPAPSELASASPRSASRRSSQGSLRPLVEGDTEADLPAASANSVETWIRIGQSALVSGKFVRARASYERVLALDPHHPLALHNVRKLTGLLNAPLNPESDTLATRPS